METIERLSEHSQSINSMRDVLVVRNQILDAIWGPGGWPVSNSASRQRTLTLGNAIDDGVLQGNGIPTTGDVQGKMSTADELLVNMTVGGLQYETRAYLLRPAATSNNRLVIVHGGHGVNFSGYGLSATLAKFLSAGYSVLAMFMPNYQVGSASQPQTQDLNRDGEPDGDVHGPIFAQQGGATRAMRVFLEPIAACLNWLRTNEDFLQFDMTGVSGGGWTSVLYPAIDPSIRVSVPASGSLPLDLRTPPKDDGDEEQKHAPIFGSSATTGIAGYRDMYALAGFGYGRRHVQVGNVHENGCCFSDDQYGPALGAAMEAYKVNIQSRLASVGAGSFDVARFTDNGNRHTISANGLDRIFAEITAFSPPSSGLFLFDGPAGLGGRAVLRANGKYAYIGADSGYSPTWTHVVATKNENLLFYRPGPSPASLAATSRFYNDGSYSYVGTVASPEPGSGWTHISAVGSEFVFFYNRGTGAAKVARIDSSGLYSVTQTLSGFATRWTDVVGLPNGGLFFFDSAAHDAYTARIDAAGTHATGQYLTGFAPYWSKVVGVNSNVLAFYASSGRVGTSLLDAQGNYSYTGATTSYIPYNADQVAGAKNGTLFFRTAGLGLFFFVDELGLVRYVQSISGFNAWTAATAN